MRTAAALADAGDGMKLMNKLYARYVEWTLAHRRVALALLLAVSAPALVLTVQFFMRIHAGLEDLLPKSAPSVQALERLHEHFDGQAHLIVIAKSNQPEANRAFIRTLTSELDALHLPQVASLQSDISVERQWAIDHAPLLIERSKFDELMRELDRGIRSATEKAFSLDLEPDAVEAVDQTALQERLDAALAEHDRYPNGVLETRDGGASLLLIGLRGSELEMDAAAALLEGVKGVVARVRMTAPADLVVAYTGEVPNVIEEHDAILADLSSSTLFVILAVGLMVVLYFRSWRAIATLAFTLIPGLLVTFAFGRLAIGYLNSNTAFLGSIIVGNGVNYPLLLLAYYRARDRDEPLAHAISGAAAQAFAGTLAAALTASAAYGALASSTLRGFSQFGWLGGAGMLLVWLMTFAAMPLAIALFSPPRVAQTGEHHPWWRRWFANDGRARAVAMLWVGVVVGLGGIGLVRAQRHGMYEMDMRVMRNTESLANGSASWDRLVNDVFGVWLNPIVGWVPDPKDREALATALRTTMLREPTATDRVDTIARLVPDEQDQTERLRRLKRLASKLRQVPPDEIPVKVRPFVKAWTADANLQPITIQDVPPSMSANYREREGRSDRTVLLLPRLDVNFDDAERVLAFAQRLGETPLPAGAVVGGAFTFMAEIIQVIRDEAPRIVGLVALLVALILVPIFWRTPARIPITVGVVTVVAVLAQAIMVLLGIRINMLNFAAVPITIGVGADYLVNLFGAIDVYGSPRKAAIEMGPAIALCSGTTIVGYFSLVLAQSGALRTFGWAAVLGELVAVGTVLLVMPLWLPSAPEQLRKYGLASNS